MTQRRTAGRTVGWPAYWPKYLPLPGGPASAPGPYPNANAVTWPQSQFAPLYLPSGSSQAYSYTKNDRPLSQVQLKANRVPSPNALGSRATNQYRGGPGGDTSAVASSYGDIGMSHTPVIRQGWIPTSTPIQPGIPQNHPAPMPAPIATAGLIPLGAHTFVSQARRNCGCAGNCGCAQTNPLSDWSTGAKVAGAAAVAGLIWWLVKKGKASEFSQFI